MSTDKSPEGGRPRVVTAAFRAQLTLSALLAVLAVLGVVNVVMFARFSGDVTEESLRASLYSAALLSGWAAWLLAAALHLRRGGRVAYRLSLFGLLLPLVVVAAAALPGTGMTYGFMVAGTASDLSILLTWMTVSSLVGGLASVAGLALVVATTVLLLSGGARRFFAPAG